MPVVGHPTVVHEVGRSEMELEVGRGQARATADEGEALGQARGERSRLSEDPFEQGLRLLGIGQRAASGRVPDADHAGVVLEVLPHSRTVDFDLDPHLSEHLTGSHPGMEEEMGGTDRTGSEDDLATRLDELLPAPSVPAEDPQGPAVLDHHLVDRPVGQNGQVSPLHRGLEEGIGSRPAPAGLLGDLWDRDPVLFGPVVVIGEGDPGGLGAPQEGRGYLPRRTRSLDPERSTGRVVFGFASR